MTPVKSYFIIEGNTDIRWKITTTKNHWLLEVSFLHIYFIILSTELYINYIVTDLFENNEFLKNISGCSSHLMLSSRFSSITNVVRRSMRWAALSHRSRFRFTASRQTRDSGTVACSDAISVHKFCTLVIFYRSHGRNIWLYKEAFHPCVVYKAAMHALEKLP